MQQPHHSITNSMACFTQPKEFFIIITTTILLSSWFSRTFSFDRNILNTKTVVNLCTSPSNNHHDYNDALAKSILFFEGQRSGKLPSNQRVKWRGDSALHDGNPDNVNLVGGYYDAGDNVKFGWPMAFSMSLLSWVALEYKQQLSASHQLTFLREAIQWGADYISQAYTSDTTLYTQVGEGNADHQCWERPEDMDTPRTLYKVTESSPGTEVAADSSAALAAASVVFKKIDSNHSSVLLHKAESLFSFADKYRGSYQGSCPFYCSYSGYQDELLWAAAWLYRATGKEEYLNYVTSNQGWSSTVDEFSWDNKYAGVQTLLSQEFFRGKKDLVKYKNDAESFICAILPGSSSARIQTTPGGLLFTRDTGNLQYVTSASMLLLIYTKALSSAQITSIQCGGSQNFSLSQIKSVAKSQVDYILGHNPLSMSYMVGYGNKYPTQLHHRGASIPSIYNLPAKVGCNEGYSRWYNSQSPNPNVHVGAIVGGPGSNDQFTDVRSDHSHLEPATYLNAAFVGSVAPFAGGREDEVACGESKSVDSS